MLRRRAAVVACIRACNRSSSAMMARCAMVARPSSSALSTQTSTCGCAHRNLQAFGGGGILACTEKVPDIYNMPDWFTRYGGRYCQTGWRWRRSMQQRPARVPVNTSADNGLCATSHSIVEDFLDGAACLPQMEFLLRCIFRCKRSSIEQGGILCFG
ncbi:hypothetical protein C8R47DRAFT_1171009 [Mycena vitilis]|nr:hypothetical protein C8R47DRAFT_1171009 [Mycena vitilis]